MQRQQLQDLDSLAEEKRKQTGFDVEEEIAREVAAKKADVEKKYMGGSTQEDFIE